MTLMQEVQKYAPCDVFNIVETSFFIILEPNMNLVIKQLSVKVQFKQHIIVALTSNANNCDLTSYGPKKV
jgi:hypothetical protein